MRTLLLMTTLSLTTACVPDVGEGKAKAEVTEPAAAAAPAELPATATTLAVDPASSTLKALGAKITATHPIVVHDYTGEVQLDGDQVLGVSYVAQMASVEADHPKLTAHLKTEDFFDVPNHPTSTFTSTAIEPGATAEGATHTVTGRLTIRGETKQVRFPATLEVTPEAVKAKAEFTINRQDFGVAYPGRPDDLVQDNVVLTIDFVAPRS